MKTVMISATSCGECRKVTGSDRIDEIVKTDENPNKAMAMLGYAESIKKQLPVLIIFNDDGSADSFSGANDVNNALDNYC